MYCIVIMKKRNVLNTFRNKADKTELDSDIIRIIVETFCAVAAKWKLCLSIPTGHWIQIINIS